jgi:short-subunit dehydrogenase
MPLDHLAGRTALVTGASRGLGRYIARALAKERMDLVLVARSAAGLSALKAELEPSGVTVHTRALDIADRAAFAALLEEAERVSGGIDVLINNAGVETVSPFHELLIDEMDRMLNVNLAAAMAATRLVLPAMLRRRRGQIVNMASLAGKLGPPLVETYAVTKAGLIAFTQSLRASYEGTGVGASVICPGYVSGAGMFADRTRRDRVRWPRMIGTSSPEAVAEAVVRALKEDAPEILVTPGPARLVAALSQLAPRLPGYFIRRMKLRDLYRAHVKP